MIRINLGTVEVWEDAKEVLDPTDIEEALRKHARGHCVEGGLRARWRALDLLVHGRGFWSEHRDRNGTKFVICTDAEGDPVSTHLCLDRR